MSLLIQESPMQKATALQTLVLIPDQGSSLLIQK
jgi:hypothetical protein